MTPTPRVGLRFTPGNHTYRLDGRPVPGVTSIIGVLDKPALPRWAARSVAEYVADHRDAVEHLYDMGRGPMVDALRGVPWQRRDDAATRGTSLHDIAERIAGGEEVDVPEPLIPLVEQALAFMEDYQIVPVATERSVASREHRFAGKFDLIADSKVGRAIWDYKSGKAIYPETALQLNAYAGAEFMGECGDESPVPECEAAYGVHIREDGYDVIPLEFGRHVYREFLVIREAFDIAKRVRGDWKVPGSGYARVPLLKTSEDDTP